MCCRKIFTPTIAISILGIAEICCWITACWRATSTTPATPGCAYSINNSITHSFPNYQFVFPKKPYLNAAQFASLSAFERNVNAMVDTSLRNGAKPILLTFAYHLSANYSRQGFLQQALDYRNPDHYDSRDVYNWGPPDYVRAGLQQENAVLRNIAAQRNVALIDIDAAMSGRGEWFGDVCHFNNEGVAVFSAQVASALAASAAEQSAPVLSP
jgi:hypothetical protein